jgi:hypothetical protein
MCGQVLSRGLSPPTMPACLPVNVCVVPQVASLAASAGVGGGAFFVPLAMICLSMSEPAAERDSKL